MLFFVFGKKLSKDLPENVTYKQYKLAYLNFALSVS